MPSPVVRLRAWSRGIGRAVRQDGLFDEILLAVTAGMLGLFTNTLYYPARDDVALLFGGTWAMMSALVLGPLHGALSAWIAYSLTPAWGHPPHVLFSAFVQCFAVGVIVRRWKAQPADIFWAVLAIAILSVAGLFALSHSPASVWAALLIAPASALIQVAAAALAVNAGDLPARLGVTGTLPHLRPIRVYLLSGVVLATLVPLTLLIVEQDKAQQKRHLAATRQSLEQAAEGLADSVEEYLWTHREAVASLAAAVDDSLSRGERAGVSTLLARYAAIHPGFVSLLAADASGALTASFPGFNTDGKVVLPHEAQVENLDYFLAVKRTGTAYVSGVSRGRGLGTEPIVAISAPLRGGNGEFAGIVEGSLRLSRFSHTARHLERRDRLGVILLDRKRRVVYATSSLGLKELDDSSVHPWSGPTRASAGRETPLLARMETRRLGWTAIVALPAQLYLSDAAEYCRQMALWTLAAILVCLTLGTLTAKLLTDPLESMVRQLRRLSYDAPSGVTIDLPAGAPAELHHLATSLETITAGLAASYSGMQDSLDERIRLNQELTRLLMQLKDRTSELDDARLRAEEADRVKAAFLANLSHEIKTPLHGLMGMLTLLLDSPLDAEQRGRGETAFESASALLLLLNDLLQFSADPPLEKPSEVTAFEPAQVIEHILTKVRPAAKERELQLLTYIDPKAQCRLQGEARTVEYVFGHIAGNALKFTHRGSIRLAVLVKEERGPWLRVRFEVSDTGVGVPLEAQQELFEPFTQADMSSTRRHGGTGIGLAVCKKMVERMGGSIGMLSQQGIGSLFWFELPLERIGVSGGPAGNTGACAETAAGQPPRVLVVDDNPVNRKVASRLVEKAGFAVDVAQDGEEALRLLSLARYAAVLMDCQMPRMDGYQTTAEIRQRERGSRRTPVIALTANDVEGDRQRCLAAGMDDYLPKPLRQNDLQAVLERWAAAGYSPSTSR